MNEVNFDNEIECYNCHFIKPTSKYFPCNISRRNFICKDCVNSKQKSRNKDKERKCRKCGLVKNIDEYYRHANNSRRKICKECYELTVPIESKQRNFLTDKRHKESDREYKKRIRTHRYEYILLKSARSRAIKNNLSFDLTEKDIYIPDKCPILNISLKQNKRTAQDDSITLDKVIPELGYVKNNSKIISRRANIIKNNGTADEHEKVAIYIRENHPHQIDYQI